MPFSFEKSKKEPEKEPAKQAEAQKLDAKTAAYRQRAANDAERYKLAVDSGYWLCFCFRSRAARDRFADAVHADGEYCFGDVLEEIAPAAPGARRGFAPKNQRMDAGAPDPYDHLGASDGTVNGDALAMADALMAAFAECEGRESSCVYNSPYHVTAIFRSRKDKDEFVRTRGLGQYGYDYLDGDKAAKAMGVGC